MDIGGWLRSLGLERYEAAFRENANSIRSMASKIQRASHSSSASARSMRSRRSASLAN